MSLSSIFFVILALVFVAGFALTHAVLRRLRARHADTWEALGRPTLIMNNSISNSLAVIRFIFRRDYSDWDDPEFTRMADSLRVFWIVYTIFFGLIIIGNIVGIFV
jgi:hypothetical protein